MCWVSRTVEHGIITKFHQICRLPIADIFLDRKRRRKRRAVSGDSDSKNDSNTESSDYSDYYDYGSESGSDQGGDADSFADYYDSIGADYSEGKAITTPVTDL